MCECAHLHFSQENLVFSGIAEDLNGKNHCYKRFWMSMGTIPYAFNTSCCPYADFCWSQIIGEALLLRVQAAQLRSDGWPIRLNLLGVMPVRHRFITSWFEGPCWSILDKQVVTNWNIVNDKKELRKIEDLVSCYILLDFFPHIFDWSYLTDHDIYDFSFCLTVSLPKSHW